MIESIGIVVVFFLILWAITGEAPWSGKGGERRRFRKHQEARGCTCFEPGWGLNRPMEYRRGTCPVHKDQTSPW